MNHKIQSLWLGKNLSKMELLSICSFLHNGHEYELYVYEDLDVPRGINLKDANQIIDKKQIFKDMSDSYNAFSDVFRYQLLYQKGGYWVDTDIVCLKPFDFQDEYVFAGEKTKKGSQNRKMFGYTFVNSCVMKVPAGSELLKFCSDLALKVKTEKSTPQNVELGPPIITQGVRKYGLKNYVAPFRTFNPIDWWDCKDILSSNFITKLKNSYKLSGNVYAVHLWNSMWNNKYWMGQIADKNASYHPKCLYEKLKARYINENHKNN